MHIDYKIEPASIDDLPRLPELEASATDRFPSQVLPPALPLRTDSFESLVAAQADGRILVARAEGGSVMGFVLVESLGADGLLEELDIAPEYGRQGIGAQLVEAACSWASAQAHARIVLSTFREVPWNEPFYARLGFCEIPESQWTSLLRGVRATEGTLGFDLDERVLMARALGEA
jgi:GNAT superfamily N-acetyltransferase